MKKQQIPYEPLEFCTTSFTTLITLTMICSYYLLSPIITHTMSVLSTHGGTGPLHTMFGTFSVPYKPLLIELSQ